MHHAGKGSHLSLFVGVTLSVLYFSLTESSFGYFGDLHGTIWQRLCASFEHDHCPDPWHSNCDYLLPSECEEVRIGDEVVCHCICAEGQIQRSLKVGMSVEDPPVIVTTVPLLYDNGFKLAWAAMGFCEEPCNCTGRHHQCATQRDVDARGSRWYAFPGFDQQLPHLYPSNCSDDNASTCNCSCPQGFVPHPAPGYDEMEYAVPRPWKWFCLDRNECGGGFHSTSPAFQWWPQSKAELPENGQPQHNCHKNATCRNTPGSVLRPEMQSSTSSREVFRN